MTPLESIEQMQADQALFHAFVASLSNGFWTVLDHSALAISHTGDTVETALKAKTAPALALGANGLLRITTRWSMTNNANNKTARVRLGGITGTQYLNLAIASQLNFHHQLTIANRNATNSQVGAPANLQAVFGVSTTALVTSAIDTTADQDIVFSGQLANAGDTITLEEYLIELHHRA
jgi:hypothetical protein